MPELQNSNRTSLGINSLIIPPRTICVVTTQITGMQTKDNKGYVTIYTIHNKININT